MTAGKDLQHARAIMLVHESIQMSEDGSKFNLHSGGKSYWIADLLKIRHYFAELMRYLRPNYQLVGIELGGMLIVQSVYPGAPFIRKNGVFYPAPLSDFSSATLIDDVVTTESSMAEASMALETNYGIQVKECLCILDRRIEKKKVLEIRSLVTAADLGLEPR